MAVIKTRISANYRLAGEEGSAVSIPRARGNMSGGEANLLAETLRGLSTSIGTTSRPRLLITDELERV